MTETEVGIGLSGPLLNAQTLGHEQRGGRSPGWRMVAGMRRYCSGLEYLGGLVGSDKSGSWIHSVLIDC